MFWKLSWRGSAELKSISTGRTGCVHGRFQPFHNGHLEYVLYAYERVDVLFVGLTNPDPSHLTVEELAPHRHLRKNNPFPYYLRMQFARTALIEAGCADARLRFVPFPLSQLDLLSYYVPDDAVHFVCVFDKWGAGKVERLQAGGFRAEGIRELARRPSGSEIRARLGRGESVAGLVPPILEHQIVSLWPLVQPSVE